MIIKMWEKNKIPGYTLAEMLITVMIVGLALPIIFSVLINSYSNLSKIENARLDELKRQQLESRVSTDFAHIFRIYHLAEDSIAFTTIRNQSFQDHVAYFFRTDTLYIKINHSEKKKVFTNLIENNTRFEFKNYDDTNYLPGNGRSFTVPEMNTLDKLIFSYAFESNSGAINNEIIQILEMQ